MEPIIAKEWAAGENKAMIQMQNGHMDRMDDVIKVSGYRLGSAEVDGDLAREAADVPTPPPPVEVEFVSSRDFRLGGPNNMNSSVLFIAVCRKRSSLKWVIT